MRRGCPVCGGELLPPDALGLRISHSPTCALGMAEDSEAELDWRRAGDYSTVFERRVTTTEATILVACGAPPAEAYSTLVRISFPTRSLRQRRFLGITVALLPGIDGSPAAGGGQ